MKLKISLFYLLSFVFICCIILCNSYCHLLSLIVMCCHLLSLVVNLCTMIMILRKRIAFAMLHNDVTSYVRTLRSPSIFEHTELPPLLFSVPFLLSFFLNSYDFDLALWYTLSGTSVPLYFISEHNFKKFC